MLSTDYDLFFSAHLPLQQGRTQKILLGNFSLALRFGVWGFF